MLISSALAWNSVPGTQGSGGASALTVIILVAITGLLINVVIKKWRKRRQMRRAGNGE